MAAVAAPYPFAQTSSPARLAPPPLRPGYVERDGLLERLDRVCTLPLTVVHAPTGYGKTMLLARWAESTPVRCAWATLSASERTPSRLWPFLAAALARSVDDVATSLRLQRVAATRSSATQMRALVEAAGALDEELVLVLDDLQLAGPSIDSAIARLLERLPPTLHLLLSTRRQPDLELA